MVDAADEKSCSCCEEIGGWWIAGSCVHGAEELSAAGAVSTTPSGVERTAGKV